jgi:hypothetical protein
VPEQVVHPAAARAFAALDRAGVRWLLLRGERKLAAPPHDLDLLVDPGDAPRLAGVLAPLGFAPVPTWARASHRFFVAWDEALGEWLQLDVVTELAYGPHYAVALAPAGDALAARRRTGAVWTLAPGDGFWTLLLHCVLDRGSISREQGERLEELARADGGSELAARLVGTAEQRACAAAARAGDTASLVALRGRWLRRAALARPAQFGRRLLTGALQWRVHRLHTALRARGLRVRLQGPPDATAAAAAAIVGSFRGPARVVGGRRARVRAFAHQSLGRLVLLDERGGGRCDVVLEVDEPVRVATLNARIWASYRDRLLREAVRA